MRIACSNSVSLRPLTDAICRERNDHHGACTGEGVLEAEYPQALRSAPALRSRHLPQLTGLTRPDVTYLEFTETDEVRPPPAPLRNIPELMILSATGLRDASVRIRRDPSTVTYAPP